MILAVFPRLFVSPSLPNAQGAEGEVDIWDSDFAYERRAADVGLDEAAIDAKFDELAANNVF